MIGDATALRTDLCGKLRLADAGRTVTVCGWVDRRREHSEHLAFVDLRDRTGIVQCVVDGARDLRGEYVVRITGTVRARPEGTANERLATGEIELADCEVEVLSASEPPPFPLHERTEVDETIRLRYRYVDLRTERLQRNLRARAAVNSAVRRAMEAQGFVEVETPMLIASMPEGARDFVVPSRKEPGAFYALPQSPQLFKQLCMVGGIDRYYQIARCLRDEDLRADRQFEFMQLDVEMSFAARDDVFGAVGEAVAAATEAVTGRRPGQPPLMTWTEAMERFGSDKPDTRFGMELVELTPLFGQTGARVLQAPCVKGIRLRGGAAGPNALSRSRVDELVEAAKRWGAKGLAWMRVVPAEGEADGGGSADGRGAGGGEADGEGAVNGGGAALEAGIAKLLSPAESAGVIEALEAEPGDMVFLVADERPVVRQVLGSLRLELGRPPVGEGGLNYLWVVDFPLFEGLDADGRPVPSHHPFTMPHADDLDRLEQGSGPDLLDVRSQAYDLVVNGWELGSGSVRIHRADVQRRIFELLGIGAEQAQARFGFLLDAFRFGVPPHAGFAVGLDRLTALLAGEENIREVIAFPKTQSGTDPLTNAPSPIGVAHLSELGLRVAPPP